MLRRRRFHRTDIAALSVGDVIRGSVLHQSRTGMIARIRFSGRIEAVTPETVGVAGAPSFVEGMLRTKSGVVQSFKLTRKDRVLRQPPGPAAMPPSTAKPVKAAEPATDDSNRVG